MINRFVGASAVLLVAAAFTSAGAQEKSATVTWASLRGTWTGVSHRLNSDKVLVHVRLTFGPGEKVMAKRDNDPPVPTRVVAMGGDSVVVEYGPVPSKTRAGHTVTVREAFHMTGHTMHGTVHSTFDDGQTLDGTLNLSRVRAK